MADDSKVWDHIADLHKKHSELAIQLHEMRGGQDDGDDREAHAAYLKEQAEHSKRVEGLLGEIRDHLKGKKDDDDAGKRGGEKAVSGKPAEGSRGVSGSVRPSGEAHAAGKGRSGGD